eukprot:CAMPEP_0202501032 /NCGR_PEP_ID=MMETSP1361-20130828/34878_1 /ASSEMBLY_ACC=CAM_ASM_000849 /TAXON_ID=210615 /ORGANISM="Staurosira complex sp., Strain CCMP2646" /LENGTH=170 /DNA_ID=CAMNT_0049133663 /DNA_START=90 /DNA_END=601 /DNA_ORIENTATION=-
MAKGAAFGLFSYTNPAGSCTGYRNTEFSVFEKTARVAAVVAPVFALAAISLQLVDILCWRVCCGKCFETVLLILAIVLQFLTFSAFGSKNYCLSGILARQCYISTGGIYTIVAFCLFFTGGVIACFSPVPTPILCREHKHESDEESNEESSDNSDEEEGFESANEEETEE